MAKNYYDITLALAGICQSARLVQQLAHQACRLTNTGQGIVMPMRYTSHSTVLLI